MSEGQQQNGQLKVIGDLPIRTNPFGDNAIGLKAYQRAERIVGAVYLLTNHIAETEPVRARAREVATSLLTSILELRDELRNTTSIKFRSAQAIVRELISLLQVANVGGLVSINNTKVVIEVIDELGVFLQSAQRTVYAESIALVKDDLTDTDNVKDTNTIKDVYKTSKDVRNALSDMSDSSQTSSRTSRIVALLNTKQDAGIRDISSHLPEYSEKMIQRELAHLVSLGQVKKNGSKRWSTYSLVR